MALKFSMPFWFYICNKIHLIKMFQTPFSSLLSYKAQMQKLFYEFLFNQFYNMPIKQQVERQKPMQDTLVALFLWRSAKLFLRVHLPVST